MNIYYHPILGMQYTLLGDTFLIDISEIPPNLNVKEVIRRFNKCGVQFENPAIKEIFLEITNYDLN